MAAPANDNWADAEVVTLDSAGEFASGLVPSTEATREVDEPYIDTAGAPDRTIWYALTAPATGDVTVSLSQSTVIGDFVLDTLMGVYTGASLAGLSLVASNDDGADAAFPSYWSEVTFAATEGTTYFVQVGLLDENKADVNYVTTFSMPAVAAPPRSTFGLVLDSTAVVDVVPPLASAGGSSGPSTALHVVTPTVPVPTLVNGRPQ